MKENGLTINAKVKHIHSMCNNKLLKALWWLKSVMAIQFPSWQFQYWLAAISILLTAISVALMAHCKSHFHREL